MIDWFTGPSAASLADVTQPVLLNNMPSRQAQANSEPQGVNQRFSILRRTSWAKPAMTWPVHRKTVSIDWWFLVSNGAVAVVIPTRASESGLASVFKPLFPLFPPEALDDMKHSGIFALSEPGKLERALDAAGLTVVDDEEIEVSIIFDDTDAAQRAFVGAGPTALAIRHSGEETVAEALPDALAPFMHEDGHVALPTWYRVVLARA